MYDNYERRNQALDLRGVEPTLGRASNQIPEAYVTYQELKGYLAGVQGVPSDLLALFAASLQRLEQKVNDCCSKPRNTGRYVMPIELARTIGRK